MKRRRSFKSFVKENKFLLTWALCTLVLGIVSIVSFAMTSNGYAVLEIICIELVFTAVLFLASREE